MPATPEREAKRDRGRRRVANRRRTADRSARASCHLRLSPDFELGVGRTALVFMEDSLRYSDRNALTAHLLLMVDSVSAGVYSRAVRAGVLIEPIPFQRDQSESADKSRSHDFWKGLQYGY